MLVRTPSFLALPPPLVPGSILIGVYTELHTGVDMLRANALNLGSKFVQTFRPQLVA